MSQHTTSSNVQDRSRGDRTENRHTSTVKNKANEVVEETRSMADEAGAQAKSQVSIRKEEAAGQLHGVAEALRQTSRQLREQDQTAFAGYGRQMADQVDRASDYLQKHSVDDLLHDAESFARRQPELFLGGAFTLGLIAARFMKSSASPTDGYRQHSDTRHTRTETPRYTGGSVLETNQTRPSETPTQATTRHTQGSTT